MQSSLSPPNDLTRIQIYNARRRCLLQQQLDDERGHFSAMLHSAARTSSTKSSSSSSSMPGLGGFYIGRLMRTLAHEQTTSTALGKAQAETLTVNPCSRGTQLCVVWHLASDHQVCPGCTVSAQQAWPCPGPAPDAPRICHITRCLLQAAKHLNNDIGCSLVVVIALFHWTVHRCDCNTCTRGGSTLASQLTV